jgi:hypothetical protein
VAQRQTVLAELGLELRAEGTSLDAGGARDRVHLDNTVERAHVD